MDQRSMKERSRSLIPCKDHFTPVGRWLLVAFQLLNLSIGTKGCVTKKIQQEYNPSYCLLSIYYMPGTIAYMVQSLISYSFYGS